MKLASLVFVDFNTCRQQRIIVASSGLSGSPVRFRSREHHASPDAAQRRCFQCGDERRCRNKVRGCQRHFPLSSCDCRKHQSVEFAFFGIRSASNNLRTVVAEIHRRWEIASTQFLTRGIVPVGRKHFLKLQNCWPLQPQMSVAPLTEERILAQVFITNIHSSGEAD